MSDEVKSEGKDKEEIEVGASRRSFLKTGVLTLGAMSALAATGATGARIAEAAAGKSSRAVSGRKNYKDVDMSRVNPIPPAKAPAKWDYETDVLVIGWGVGGTMAALSASKTGAKVIALEKNTKEKWPEHAGVHAIAGTGGREWAAAKKRTWGPEDVKACADEMWAMNDYSCDYKLLVRQLEEWQNVLDLLHSLGLKFQIVDLSDSFDEPGQKYSALMWTSINTDLQDFTPMDPWVNKYLGVESTIERALTKNGSTRVFYNSPVTNFVQDSSGRVIGVKATMDGKVKYVKAKATVLATGGYGANWDMCKYYTYITDFCGCHVGAYSNEGDGIRMAQGLGAGLTCMPCVGVADGGVDMIGLGRPWNYRQDTFFKDHTVSAYTTAVIQLARQPSLKINSSGKRFMDENGTWKKKTMAASVQPGKKFFTIFDKDIEGFIKFIKGSRYGMCENMITPDFRVYFSDEDIRPLWDWKDSLAEGKKLGTIIVADTLEELASKMRVNKRNFLKTVSDYNRYCENGVDEEFGKHKSFLYPIKKGPFMAIQSKPAFLWVTQGGIRVDEKWRALKEDGSDVIPGLYVGSSDCGGTMKPYNFGMENYFQQASSALISGKVAGMNAALEALGKEPV